MIPKPLKIAEIILLIVVIAGGGWWLMRKPMQTWKTHSDAEYGYEIRHPNNFEPKDCTNSYYTPDIHCELFSNAQDYYSVIIKISPKQFSDTELYNGGKQEMLENFQQDAVTINGAMWTRISYITRISCHSIDDYCPVIPMARYLIQHNNKWYLMIPGPMGVHEDTEAIVATFRFTN